MLGAMCEYSSKMGTNSAFDVDVGFGLKNRSVGCGKQSALVCLCVEEGDLSCL